MDRQPPREHSGFARRTLLKLAGASAALTALDGCSPENDLPNCDLAPDIRSVRMREAIVTPEVNLARRGIWVMSGARQTADGIALTPINKLIENRDKGEYQQDYPLNYLGTYVHVPNTCRFEVDIDGADGTAFHCYGEPPLIRDDYRVDTHSLRMFCDGDQLRVLAWNGEAEPAINEAFPLPTDADRRRLTLHRRGDSLHFDVDSKTLGGFRYDLFPHGTAWFGFDSTRNPATIRDFRITATEQVKAYDTSTMEVTPGTNGLQQIATEKGLHFKFGATLAPGPMAHSAMYNAIAFGGNYGAVGLENELKMVRLNSAPGKYHFETADKMVDLARKHGLEVHGHTLVFARSLPPYARNHPVETVADREAVKRIMVNHITRVMTHFRGRVASWDVVNEVLADYDGGETHWREDSIWYRAMGKEYVEIALRAARAADPDAKLIINENAIENDENDSKKQRLDFLINEIAIPMARKGLLDGIGMQGHEYELPRDEIKASTLENRSKQLKAEGLFIRISEMDISVKDEDAKADQFVEVLKAAIASGNFDAFYQWGVKNGFGNDGLAWDANGCATKSITEMKKILQAL